MAGRGNGGIDVQRDTGTGPDPSANPSIPPSLPLLAAAAAVALLAATLTAVPSLDLWWQLRAGELIWNTGRIPHTDLFSWTSRGQPWLVHEWLVCVLFYGLFHASGPGALVVLKSIALLSTFGLVGLRAYGRSHSLILSLLATLLVAYAGRPFWDIRPTLVTYAGVALFLLMLDRHADSGKPAALLPLPVLQLVWANCHAGALLGPALILVCLLGNGVASLFGVDDYDGSADRLLPLSATLVACLFAILATPWGLGLWLYPLRLLSHPHVTDFITEWFSPDFHYAGYRLWELLLLLLLAAVALRPRRVYPDDLLLILASTYAALLTVRHLPLLLLTATPVLAGWAGPALNEAMPKMERPPSWAAGLGALVCLAIAFHQARPAFHQPLFGYSTVRASCPEAAVHFLHTQGLPGPLWNEYQWGGYLIWTLPRYPVFIDGRAEVYYDTCFDDFRAVHDLQPGWRQRLARWNVRLALLDRSGLLAQALALDPDWRCVFSDPIAVVYVRQR